MPAFDSTHSNALKYLQKSSHTNVCGYVTEEFFKADDNSFYETSMYILFIFIFFLTYEVWTLKFNFLKGVILEKYIFH